jgi:glucosamine-6-phosphate deaminase
MDEAARRVLAIAPDRLGQGSPIRVERVADNETLIRRLARDLLDDYRAAKAAGRDKVVMIVPVGPVGAFDLLAAACNEQGQSLADLVVINMDEYLEDDGRRFIPADDALSFRGHMQRHLWDLLRPGLAPPEAQRLFPDPRDPGRVPETIARLGGVDVCYGGVGITGHVAFNDPPQADEPDDVEAFAALPTRVVELSLETRVINSVTAARGNIDRVPRLAVTVGMAEILGARLVRLYLNRPWQGAIVRKLLHGPVTARVPASLLQRHPDCRVVLTDEVAQLPEPTLR